jgi:ribosome recycling factor
MPDPDVTGARILGGADERMRLALDALERDFQKVRVGAASGSLLDAVLVDHHGRRARLIEIASVSVPDPRQIVIRPWDPASLRSIGAAISQSRIGLTPTIDGGAIHLYVPELSEERRLELVGLVHDRMERAKVEIRAIRHDTLSRLRDRARAHQGGSDDIARDTERLQRLTDRSIGEVDRLGAIKQASILRL